MQPNVTSVSLSETTLFFKPAIARYTDHLQAASNLPSGEALRIEFSDAETAQRAKPGYYIYAKRKGIRIKLSIYENVIYLTKTLPVNLMR